MLHPPPGKEVHLTTQPCFWQVQHAAEHIISAANRDRPNVCKLHVQVNAFRRTDEHFYEAVHRKHEPERDAGTTALAALVAGNALLVANAGDCRAVICRRGRAIDLSRDHNGKSEAARVVEAGGTPQPERTCRCIWR